jgi:hypothetical protein
MPVRGNACELFQQHSVTTGTTAQRPYDSRKMGLTTVSRRTATLQLGTARRLGPDDKGPGLRTGGAIRAVVALVLGSHLFLGESFWLVLRFGALPRGR